MLCLDFHSIDASTSQLDQSNFFFILSRPLTLGASAYPMAVSEIPPPPPRPTEFATLAEFREYLKAVQVHVCMYVCMYVCM